MAIIAATAALYVSLIRNWFENRRDHGTAAPTTSKLAAPALELARQAFRDGLLDAKAWLTLSQALARSGRPIDAFYAMEGARAFFGNDTFLRAHEQVFLKREQALEPPEANRLQAIPSYARAVHAGPQTYAGQKALAELGKLAAAREDGPQAESSHLAREALEELLKAHPADPRIFSTLGFALWARGDLPTVRALVEEVGRKNPRHAGVAVIEGALALQDNDSTRAVQRLTAAWEADPENVYSSQKLAEIYDLQRGEPEAALPFYISLYLQEPLHHQGTAPLEEIVRRILDTRRLQLLKGVPAEGLGGFLKSEDASLRAEACVRAAELKDPRWIELLAELLDDDTEIVRHNADYALYQIAKAYPDAVLVRRDEWLAGGRVLQQARVLNLFADLWPGNTWPLVERAISDQNPALRYLVKTMVLDNYYHGVAAAARAKAQYLAREKDPRVLALYAVGHR